MLSQHKRISEQRASAGGIRLTAQETQRADEWETTLAVRSIWNIARMRTRPLLSGSINDLNFLKVSSSHAGGLLRSAHFADGLFLLAYTKGFLEDREHRLVLRAEGGVEYFRRPVNVDCQRIESRPVHVTTIQEIASDPISLLSIATLAGAVSIEAEYGWQHAFGQADLGLLQGGVPVRAPDS